VARVPVRVHLATPIGLFVFTGFSFHPVLWAGFVLIILVHELGHAALVRKFRLPVRSIDINGIGGVCRYEGRATEVQESVIAWGGVLAQAVLLAVVQGIGQIWGFHDDTLVGQIAKTLIAANVFLMAVNLVPFPPLDGAKAWMLFRWRNLKTLAKRSRRAALKARAAAIEREMDALREADRLEPESRPRKPHTLN
jgi:Zn-dependent protease